MQYHPKQNLFFFDYKTFFFLTKSVLWKFEWTRWNINFPNIVAIVGNIRPPQISLVNDAGLEFPLRSVGTRGKYDGFSKMKLFF